MHDSSNITAPRWAAQVTVQNFEKGEDHDIVTLKLRLPTGSLNAKSWGLYHNFFWELRVEVKQDV